MPRPKIRPVSSLEVKISRDGEYAVFDYADEAMGGGIPLNIGPEINGMTNEELLQCHNNIAIKMQVMRETYEHVAIEIPIGKPQIEFSRKCHQWSMRGDVLRAYISDTCSNEAGEFEPIIEVDGKELSWSEFGKMITVFVGWGMRLAIVPDDELHVLPNIQVRNSRNKV